MAKYCSQCGNPLTQGAGFCTHCGSPATDTHPTRANLQSKRDKVMGKWKSTKNKRTKTLLIIGFIAVLGGWLYTNLPESSNPTIKTQPVVMNPTAYPPTRQDMISIASKVENGKIIIPLAAVKEKKFVAFNYVAPTKTVPLLAYISGEGKLVTAVSMCEPCDSKRFHIRGEQLVCNACDSTWELNTLQAISGACGRYPPDAIPSEVVADEVQIDEAIVARWQRRI